MRTSLDVDDARKLVLERYGYESTVRTLPSYADLNFRIETSAGERFVLKLSHEAQPRAELELENAAFRHLEAKGVACPRLVRDLSGGDLSIAGARCVRLLSWIEGRPLAEVAAPPLELFSALGTYLGELDTALHDFTHSAARRSLGWDLQQACDRRAFAEEIPEERNRRRVTRIFERFADEVLPPLRSMPQGVVHNDANDWNILVHTDDSARLAGLLDFGDMVETALVCEPAIAMTYAMLEKSSPGSYAAALLAGYLHAYPLSEAEVRLLPALIETRLAVSVASSAHERLLRPDNAYLGVTEPHAWALLGFLAERPPRELEDNFLDTLARSSSP